MYLDYFRLNTKPFSIAPDPGFLYPSPGHREAMAHLTFGLESEGGFVLVTGEVGTGKTMLLRRVIAQVPRHLDVAFVLNPKLNVRELLETLCQELGVQVPSVHSKSIKTHIDQLNKHLLKTHSLGKSTVVILDEAQNLSPAVLEQLRLLTNLETNERKLLRIILLGQPELSEMLETPELRQLAQRITARYHLEGLSRSDTGKYIGHRLHVAGGSSQTFTPTASRMVYRLSKGIPRVINSIADRSLLGAYVEGQHRVTPAIVRYAAREVLGQPKSSWHWWLIGTGCLLLSMGAAWAYLVGPLDPTLKTQTLQQVIPAETSPLIENTSIIPTTLDPEPNQSATRNILSTSVTHAEPEPQKGAEKIIPDTSTLTVLRPPEQTQYRSLRSAFDAIFTTWGAPFDHAIVPCEQAPRVGLQCLTQIGALHEIIDIDRPAVIRLTSSLEKDPFYAAVLRYNNDSLIVRVGNAETAVPLQSPGAQRWRGQFTVLWQRPPGYNGSLYQNSEGRAVAWVRKSLGIATGLVLDSPKLNRYDKTLYSAVTAFQKEHGLTPDGIIGPRTWMQLNVASRVPSPTLD